MALDIAAILRRPPLTLALVVGAAAAAAVVVSLYGGRAPSPVAALLVAGLGAILLVRSPVWALASAAFYIPFDSSAFALDMLPFGLTVPKVLGTLLVLAVLYQMAMGRLRLRFFDNPLDYAVVLYLVLVLASGAANPLTEIGDLSRLLRLAAFYFAVKHLLVSTRAFDAMMWAIAISGMVTSSFGLRLFAESLEERDHPIRVGGFFMDPNYYAAVMLVTLMVCLYLALYVDQERLWLRLVAGLGAISITVAIVLTGSRAGLLNLALVGLLLILRSRQRARLIPVALVCAALTVPLWPRTVLDRVAGTFAREPATIAAEGARLSTHRRAAYLDVGLARFAERPLFGHGYLGFSELFASSDFVRWDNPLERRQRRRVAHNTYLEVAVGSGLPALIAYLLLLGNGLGRLRRVYRAGSGPVAHAASMLGIGLVSLASSMLFLSIDTFKMTWLLLGVAAALPSLPARAARARRGVCMITRGYPPVIAGAERVAALLARELAATGTPVLVVTTLAASGGTEPCDDPGTRVVKIAVPDGKRRAAIAFLAGGLRAAWRHRYDFDVVHCHQMFSAATLGLLIHWLAGKPLIVNPHRGGAEGDVAKLRRKSIMGRLRLLLLAEHASAFVALSDEIASELRSIGVGADRVVALRNRFTVAAVANEYAELYERTRESHAHPSSRR